MSEESSYLIIDDPVSSAPQAAMRLMSVRNMVNDWWERRSIANDAEAWTEAKLNALAKVWDARNTRIILAALDLIDEPVSCKLGSNTESDLIVQLAQRGLIRRALGRLDARYG